MKQFQLLLLTFIFCSVFTTLQAQTYRKNFNKKQQGDWFLGIGFNTVSDSGKGKLADIFGGKNGNFSNPFILQGEYFTNKNFSIQARLSFNNYKSGKIIDSRTIQQGDEPSYLAIDFNSKYHFAQLIHSNVLEPFVVAGIGYTTIKSYTALNETVPVPTVGRVTINTGVGTNYWFTKNWAIQVDVLGKFGLKSEKNSAYITGQTQFTVGTVYRLTTKRRYY